MAKSNSNRSSVTQGSNLSSSFKKSIDEYKNKFKHIEGTINQIRARPGMYIGPIGALGLKNMFREIFQNSVDQMLLPESPCNYIKVFYDERNYKVIVSDNGMGIPFDIIVKVYIEGHTGTHLGPKKKFVYAAGINGIGAKATNALSEYFDVKSYRYDGQCKHVRFEKGVLVVDETVSNPKCLQGTTVEFIPDSTVMGDTPLDPSEIRTLIRDTLDLLSIGDKVGYEFVSRNGKSFSEEMVNNLGVVGSIESRSPNLLIQPIHICYDNGDMKLDMAMSFDLNLGEDIISYANLCPTSTAKENTHVQGVLDGVCSWFSGYMNKIFLTDREKKKIAITSVDVRSGLRLMISAFHLDPQFTGQAKEVFSNADYKPFAKSVVVSGLDDWSKSNSQDLLKVCKFLKDIATARIKADTEKIKVTAKYTTDVITGLPDSYVPPSGPASEGWELFIVEGKSALGSARDARNPRIQGIYPIRGKILNAWQATTQKISDNAELMGISQILGGGYLRKFDISKVKFKRIIFMTDADHDGAHIATLLLLDFMKLFPGMVEAGMVYKAVPPLYGIPHGKRVQYFAERVDFVRYMQKEYYKNNTVTDLAGKKIDSTTFSTLLIENADYIYDMKLIVDRKKLDAKLIEEVLISYLKKEKIEALRKRLVGEYRFIENSNISDIGDSVRIKGLINRRIQTLFYDDYFINECQSIIPPIKKALDKGSMEFLVNGVRTGLYDTISSAMNSVASVSRYKGLGEMNPNQLRESTMNPDSRTLIRYTIDDIDETTKIIRSYDSNKDNILKHVSDVDRGDLIGL